MDTSEIDKSEIQKGSGNCNLSSLDSEWEFLGPNLTDASLEIAPNNNHILIPSSSCSLEPVLDSLGQTLSGHPCSVVNSRLFSVGTASRSNSVAGDSLPSSMPKEAFFLPNAPGTLAFSIPQFPNDSGFIERAARFSCFSADHFGVMMNNSFDSMGSLHPRGKGMVRGHQDVSKVNELRSVFSGQSHKNGVLDHKQDEVRAIDNVTDSEREARQSLLRRGNKCSEDAVFTDIKGHVEWSCLEGEYVEASAMGLAANKRKRDGKDPRSNLLKEAKETDNKADEKQNGETSPGSAANEASAKNEKQGSQSSDPSKGEYIHVRARRGQATNSHSLAERVRREKISERMKLLQDLVPGCSKVTGKAVMLDEIINYVQSLQQQVEFLSMKLATVTSRLDLDIEGLLTKETLHQRPGPSSTLGFPQDLPMAYPPLQQSQQALTPLVNSYLNPSGVLRRNNNPALSSLTAATNRGFKDQLVGAWNEPHDVHMSYGARSKTQETTTSAMRDASPSHAKLDITNFDLL